MRKRRGARAGGPALAVSGVPQIYMLSPKDQKIKLPNMRRLSLTATVKAVWKV